MLVIVNRPCMCRHRCSWNNTIARHCYYRPTSRRGLLLRGCHGIYRWTSQACEWPSQSKAEDIDNTAFMGGARIKGYALGYASKRLSSQIRPLFACMTKYKNAFSSRSLGFSLWPLTKDMPVGLMGFRPRPPGLALLHSLYRSTFINCNAAYTTYALLDLCKLQEVQTSYFSVYYITHYVH